jgi:RNA polymerase sigma-70 factor (ECF subfamily)
MFAFKNLEKKNILNVVTDDIPDKVDINVDTEHLSLDYLLGTIRELPERYKMVFNLYVLDDYSHKEIAELLGITIGTSKSNLSRARQILKDKIERNLDHKKKIIKNVSQ